MERGSKVPKTLSSAIAFLCRRYRDLGGCSDLALFFRKLDLANCEEMILISHKERQERVEARGAEYRAGLMSEDQFRAYLFGMKFRGEDLRLELGAWAPPAPAQTFEERRLEMSQRWLKRYLQGEFTKCGNYLSD